MNGNRMFTKCARRLVPIMMLLFVVDHIDLISTGGAGLFYCFAVN